MIFQLCCEEVPVPCHLAKNSYIVTDRYMNTTSLKVTSARLTCWHPGESEKRVQDESNYPPQLDFNLNSYQRDEAGLVANIEEAREIIRSLQKIIRFLENSPFEHLPLNTQAEISLYLIGTHLLTHGGDAHDDDQYEAKIAMLEALFNPELDATIKREKATLDPEQIVQSVEDLFKGFGK